MLSYSLSQSDGIVYLLKILQFYLRWIFLIDFSPKYISVSASPFQHLYDTLGLYSLSATRRARRHAAMLSWIRCSLISPFININNPTTDSIIVGNFRLYISFHDLHLLIFQCLLKLYPFVFLKILCLLYLKPLTRYVYLTCQ